MRTLQKRQRIRSVPLELKEMKEKSSSFYDPENHNHSPNPASSHGQYLSEQSHPDGYQKIDKPSVSFLRRFMQNFQRWMISPGFESRNKSTIPFFSYFKRSHVSQIIFYLFLGFIVVHFIDHIIYDSSSNQRDQILSTSDFYRDMETIVQGHDTPPTYHESAYNPKLDKIAIGVDSGIESPYQRVPYQLISFLSVAKNVLVFSPDLDRRQDEADTRVAWELSVGLIHRRKDSPFAGAAEEEMETIVDQIAGRTASPTAWTDDKADDDNRTNQKPKSALKSLSNADKSKEEVDKIDLDVYVTDDIETHGPFVVASPDQEAIHHPTKVDTLTYLEQLYAKFPLSDWFILISDTSFILWSNLLQELSHHDPEKPLYFGNPSIFEGCADQTNPLTTFRGKFLFYAHSGSGIILSRGAMKSLYYHIPTCRSQLQSSGCQSGDIQLSLCFKEMGITLTPLPGLFPSLQGDGFSFPGDPCRVPLIVHPVSHDGMGLLTSLGLYWEQRYQEATASRDDSMSFENQNRGPSLFQSSSLRSPQKVFPIPPIRLADIYHKWESWETEGKDTSPWDMHTRREGTRRFLLGNISHTSDHGCHQSCQNKKSCLSYSYRYSSCGFILDPNISDMGTDDEDFEDLDADEHGNDDEEGQFPLTAPSNAIYNKVIVPFEQQESRIKTDEQQPFDSAYKSRVGASSQPKRKKWKKQLVGLYDRLECQKKCDNMARCKRFEWGSSECLLFKNIPPLIRADGYVSGSMRDRFTCPGPKTRSRFFF